MITTVSTPFSIYDCSLPSPHTAAPTSRITRMRRAKKDLGRGGGTSNTKFHKNPFCGSRFVPCGCTDRQTDIYDEANSRFSQFCERVKKVLYCCSACWNYTFLKNCVKLRIHCLKKVMISMHCFSKGFLILFGQLYFKQSSTTRIKCLKQLHYAHSQVTSRGHTRIYLLVVDK